MGPTQSPVQWLPGAVLLVIKLPALEANHLPPSSAKVKNTWSYVPLPPHMFHEVNKDRFTLLLVLE